MDLSHSEGPHHHRRERKSDAEQSFFSTLLGGDVLKIYFLASRTRCPRGIAQSRDIRSVATITPRNGDCRAA
jgi:hypothetical protein